MSRAMDRTAARREARIRRAELRLFAAARWYTAAVDRAAVDPLTPAQDEATEALAEFEGAGLRFAEVSPAPARRRARGRGRA